MGITLVDLMSKKQLIEVILKSKCKMMHALPLNTMSKEQIIVYLIHSCCPVLLKLLESPEK
jgi:hypothetical protein